MNPLTQAPLATDKFDEKFIFKRAMAGNWKDLVTDFKMPHFEQDKKITKAEDTILHMAVNSGNKSDTKKLVDGARSVEVLRATNKKKNTPLHLAAALGYSDLCEYMIEAEKKKVDDKEVSLIKSRNEVGETPFFRSVFHGRREVFEYFLGIILREHPAEDELRKLCRRNDGDTILHCSIANEFFDLAWAIVHHFPFLTNARNEKGLTPLQVLANHPSVFKSGSRLKQMDILIYFCTWVDPLVVGSLQKEFKRDEIDDTSNSFLPKNYETLEKIFRGIIRIFSKSSSQKHQQSDVNEFLGNQRIKDLEGQKVLRPGLTLTHIPIDSQGLTLTHIPIDSQGLTLTHIPIDSQDGGSESPHGKNPTEGPTHQTRPIHIDSEGGISRYFPPNYTSLVYITKHLLQIALIPMGLEFGRFQRIKTQKEKNIWAAQVMKELIKNESSYEYENTGMAPTGMSPTTTTYGVLESTLKTMATDEPQLKQSTEGQEKNGVQKKKEGWHLVLGGVKYEPNVLSVYKNTGMAPTSTKYGVLELVATQESKQSTEDSKETPILTAAKLGIVEMVEEIEKTFPVAIHDTDINNKNIVHLAVENRQPLVYEYLLNKVKMSESIFQEVDKEGNSALHLAAASNDRQPWLIPGAALQIQWEIKWFKYIEDSKPMNFFAGFNGKGETPNEVFSETHKKLIEEGGKWLTNTSQSCSVVAALIATVAFASSVTVPGGVNQESGFPVLQDRLPFKIFAAASLVALCLSVTSLVMFLAILTSRYQEKDFHRDLPLKLIVGLTSLYVSLAATLVAFCAGHFFVLPEKVKYAAFPIYGITCLPISLFALAQFPLYVDLFRCTLRKVPLRKYKTVSFL